MFQNQEEDRCVQCGGLRNNGEAEEEGRPRRGRQDGLVINITVPNLWLRQNIWSSCLNLVIHNTVEIAYKVAICPRGNLLYRQIYLITDLKLLGKGVFGL